MLEIPGVQWEVGVGVVVGMTGMGTGACLGGGIPFNYPRRDRTTILLTWDICCGITYSFGGNH